MLRVRLQPGPTRQKMSPCGRRAGEIVRETKEMPDNQTDPATGDGTDARSAAATAPEAACYDAVVVGAGFSGL